MAKGFFEGILKDIMLAGALEASRDKSGKPDPYKAAGIAMGFGHTSLEDQMRLATMLGAEGAFDTDAPSGEVFIAPTTSENHLTTAITYDWRDTDLGSEYNIIPEDFDSEEEFLAAIEEAELDALSGIHLSSEDEPVQMYPISTIPDDVDLHQREIATRRYLFEKYSVTYPHVFTKDYLDQSFYEMGVRASKKAVSVELPYIMLLDLISNHNVFGLGIFYLLQAGDSKKCIDACRKYLPKILAITERLELDDIDLEALLAFIQSKVFLEMHELGAACKVLQSIRTRHPELMKDDVFVSFCMETVDFLTDGTIKASFDSKMRYLRLCADMVENLLSKKCYKKAVERTYAENEAKQLVYRFRPNDKKALLFWDVGDDFMDDFVFNLLTEKGKEVVCPVFSTLCCESSLTERQKEWVKQGIEHLAEYAADGRGDEDVYLHYYADPVLKNRLLTAEKHRGKLLGHLLAMSISKYDLIMFQDIMLQYDKAIRFSEHKRDFLKYLNQDLECVYIDPFCDSAERFSGYMKMRTELISLISDPLGKAYGNHIKRFCSDIECDYGKFIEKHRAISVEEQKHSELLKKIEAVIRKIDDGVIWRTKSPSKSSIKVTFKYPDGKNGDVNMHLASQCGEVTQVDALTRCVEISLQKRDYLPLLVRPFDNTDTLNPGARRYLSSEHNVFKMIELVEELEEHQKEVAHNHRIELSVPDGLWDQIRRSEQKYASGLTQQREEIYQALAKAGLLSAKWVSEYQVFTIISSMYDDAIYQYRADWLGSQSLDIFVPSINIAVEYQGAQHYRAVELFGGEDGLRERKKLDIRKKRLCKENGIKLVEIKYTDEISVELVKSKIDAVL